MPIMRTYECPDCGHRFEFLHLTSNAPPPSECPSCKSNMEDARVIPGAPNIATSTGKSADAVYRAMEAGSEYRAQAAADQLGVGVSELGAMKITDLRDNARLGETSALSLPVSAPVGAISGGAEVSQRLAQARVGPYAGAGGRTLGALQSKHSGVRAVMESRPMSRF